MQVTHTNEFITHAVISGATQIDMGISNSAEFFQILSSTLYSDQMLAVVRETTCNAWDAHVESERTAKPIQITVDTTKVVIRDFGHGILHELMGPIYGIYGASTKKNDGMQTGGFGLGCKAPFAYTDHFQVISNHNGTKTIYSMSKSSAQVGGKPAIIPIASFPTEETGLEVSINIKCDDMPRFLKLFQMIILNGEMNAEINGEPVVTTPYSQAKNGFVMMARNPMMTEKSGNNVCIRYGNVIYPLANHANIVGYNVLLEYLKRLPTTGYYYNNTESTIVLLAPPHSISVTPSREALSMQEHTINTVNSLIKNFIAYVDQPDMHLESVLLKESIAKATNDELLNFSFKLNKHFFNLETWKNNNLLITDYKMYRRAARSNIHVSGYSKKDVLLRIKTAANKELFAKGKAHSLYRALQKVKAHQMHEQTNWVDKHIVKPLLRKMKLNPEMNPSRLFVMRNSTCEPVRTVSAPVYYCDWHVAAKHARPYIVLHYVRKDVEYRIEKEGTLKGFDKNDVLFYHVPRIATKVQSAIDFFTAQDYHVIDLTKPLAGETHESIIPTLKESSGTRQQGLIALSAASKQGVFNAEALYSDDAQRVSTPECMFLCTNTDNQRRANNLKSFGEVSNIIMKVYGDLAGVAKTQDQYDRYRARGIEDGLKYVINDVVEYITNSDIILQYLTARKTMFDIDCTARIYDYLLKSSTACTTFNLPFITEPEDKNYLALWEHLKRFARHDVAATEKDIDSLPKHQAMADMCNKIKSSKYSVFLNTCLYVSQAQFDELIPDFINFINQ